MHAVRSTNDRKESKSEPHMCYMERLVKHAKHVMHVMHMMHVMLNDKELCNIVTDSTLNWTNRCETKCQWRVTSTLQGMKLSSRQWWGATCMIHLIFDAVTLFGFQRSSRQTTRQLEIMRQHMPRWLADGSFGHVRMRIANAEIYSFYSSGLITGGTRQSAKSASTSRESEAVLLLGTFFGSGFTVLRVILHSSHSEQTRRKNQ